MPGQFTSEFQSFCGHLSSPGLFLIYNIHTTVMGTLVISEYKRYAAVLFEGVVQLKLFVEAETQCNVIQFKGTAQINKFGMQS